jgi:hypothetical protein
MAESQRLHKSRATSKDLHSGDSRTSAAVSVPAPSHVPSSPAWASAPSAAPFSISGVQRKVAIGASNDPYEREADSVATRVAGGQRVPPGSISSISSASFNAIGQRQSKSPSANGDDKSKDQKGSAPVQREVRPEDKTKDAKATTPLQRVTSAPSKKPDEKKDKLPVPPVQRAAKSEDDKRERAPQTVHRQAKSGKPDDNEKTSSPAPVQRAPLSADKKVDEDTPDLPLQRASKSEPLKQEDKKPANNKNGPSSPSVQRDVRPEDRKKIERDPSAPVQMQSMPEQKKKDDKAFSPPVQRASQSDDKKPKQKAEAPVQRMDDDRDAHREEIPAVQTSPADGPSAPSASMENAAAQTIASKGAGEPMQSSTRDTLESGFGADLSDVRVHDDSSAHSAADALNARAFTHRNDIWLGRGESQHNVPLMAHEATHVVQQTGSVHRQLIQRAKKSDDNEKTKKKGAIVPKEPVGELETGILDPAKKEIHFASLDVPAFKASRYGGKTLKRKANYERNDPDPKQREVWKKEIKTAGAVEKLKTKAKKAQAKTEPEHVFTAKTKYGSDKVFFGDLESIAREMTLASWDSQGKGHSFDVDHILELQIANWSDNKSANTLDNMELLDSALNQESGRKIRSSIEKKVEGFIKKEGKTYGSVSYLKRKYAMVFDAAKPVDKNFTDNDHWTKKQIEDGDHIGPATKGPVKASDPSALGKKGEAKVFPTSAGGQAKTFSWPGEVNAHERDWFGPFKLIKKEFDTKNETSPDFGKLTFAIPKTNKRLKPWQKTIDVDRVTGARYAGYIDKKKVREKLRDIAVNGLSPIETDELDIGENGLQLTGRIMPEIDFLKGAAINFELNGNDIRVFKTFDTGDFKVPKPLTVTDTSFTISAGTESGLKAEGEINFEIDRVGSGSITAGASIADGLELSGTFNFDSKTFTPAELTMQYKKGELSIFGHLGIAEGKVKGIKHADITANYSKGVFTASGVADVTIPGIQQGTVDASYSEADGFVIGAKFILTDKIPGISGGELAAKVAEKDGKYTVTARGEATPKIPGITSKLIVSYDDGAFDASITAGFEKGMLKGTVTAGATNRPVDDGAKPGAKPSGHSEKVTIYGGGSVTLRLAPWLQATAAIKFKPDGQVEVMGEIGLPSVINLLNEKKFEQNIFKIGFDIPILGFSVLGQHVGIFLNVGGGLDFSAVIGPVELQDVRLSVTYNPDREQDTKVHGHAALNIPAYAGLRLSIHAALGAGIPIVDAKAGLEVGGALGVAGAAHADVDVDWTPQKGLVLDASASVFAEPMFRFNLTGYVLVEADLFIKTITLYEKRWELASFEFGSGLRFGLKLPIHYEESKPLNVALSDIQYEVPHIDPMATLKGLLDKVV